MTTLLRVLSSCAVLGAVLLGPGDGEARPGQAAGADGRLLRLSVELASYTPMPAAELLVGQPLRLSLNLADVEVQAAHARWNQLVRAERRAASEAGRPFDPSRAEFPEVSPLRLGPGLLEALSVRILREVSDGPDTEVVQPATIRMLLAGQAALPADGVSIRGRVLHLGVNLPLTESLGWEPGSFRVEAVLDTRHVDPTLGWAGLVTARSRALPLRPAEGLADECVLASSTAAFFDVGGELAAARQQLEKVVALNDHFDQSRVLLRLSDLCVRMGDEQNGLDYLQRYVSRYPEGNREHLEPLERRCAALAASLQAVSDGEQP